MQDALQRERDKAQVLLSRQRAASARRISALSEELKAARRQLDLQKTRRTKVRKGRKEGVARGPAGGGGRAGCSHGVRGRLYRLGLSSSFSRDGRE